jgi:hypothetical protein
LKHGYVTGRVPFKKLEEFLAEERKREQVAHKGIDAPMEGEVASESRGADAGPRQKEAAPVKKSKLLWYTRHMMW